MIFRIFRKEPGSPDNTTLLCSYAWGRELICLFSHAVFKNMLEQRTEMCKKTSLHKNGVKQGVEGW